MRQFYFLGHPHFTVDGSPVVVTSRRVVALLAYLAVTHSPQPREHLTALLWPESSDDAARKNLRNALWTIRKLFGDDTIHGDGEFITLDDHIWCDIQQLSNLPSEGIETELLLLSLNGESFLEGMNLRGVPDYEIWITEQRERFGQAYLRSLHDLAEMHLKHGNYEKVITISQRALSVDLLHEPFHQMLITAYARAGRRVDALQQYESLSQTLASELGVAPLPESNTLHDSILRGDFNDHNEPLQLKGLARRQPILGETPQAPFIGRSREKEILDQALARTLQGRTEVIVISGEMGIGKSRLWQEWSMSQRDEVTMLEGRGLEATRSLPFAPLIDLFSSSISMSRLTEPSTGLSPIWLAEVARVIPAIRTLLPSIPPPISLPYDEERHRLFEAFTQVLTAIRPKPVVLFVDDLHWVDHTTLDWLSYLVFHQHENGLLLVVAYRPEDASAAMVRMVAGWGRENAASKILLGKLTRSESLALVASLGSNPLQVEHVLTQSAGNPYYLIELCSSANAKSDGPIALFDLIRARVQGLPDSSRQVLQAAAILDTDFDFALLRRTSGRGEEEVLDSLDTLLGASILMEKSGNYSFVHPLVADIVRNDMSDARRVFLNRRAAAAIETANAGQTHDAEIKLMRHHASARDYHKAAMYAEKAGMSALSLSALAEAVELLSNAVTYEPSPERYMHLGIALQRSNEITRAIQALQTSLELYRQQNNHVGRARAGLELAGVYLLSGRVQDVLSLVEVSFDDLHDSTEPFALATAHFLMAAGRVQSGGSLNEAEDHLRESTRIATIHRLNDMASRSQFEYGNLRAQQGDIDAALQAYQDSAQYARQADDPLQEALSYNNYAYHSLLKGHIPVAQQYVERAIALCSALAIQSPLQYLFSTRGEISLAERRWDEALDWFMKGIEQANKVGNLSMQANYHANIGLVRQRCGDLDAALIEMETAMQIISKLHNPFLQTKIDIWLTDLYLQRGERVAAVDTMKRAQTRLDYTEFYGLRDEIEQLRNRLKQA